MTTKAKKPEMKRTAKSGCYQAVSTFKNKDGLSASYDVYVTDDLGRRFLPKICTIQATLQESIFGRGYVVEFDQRFLEYAFDMAAINDLHSLFNLLTTPK